MRTKTLILSAAAVVAGILSASAQVYSINVVGYVNRTLQGNNNYSLVANPLNTSSNTYDGILRGLPSGWSVTKWTGSGFGAGVSRTGFGTGWSPATAGTNSFVPGEAVFIKAPAGAAPITNTFVGEVLQGPITNSYPAGLSMIGSAVPAGGLVNSASISFVPPTGSAVFFWKEDGVGGYTANFNKVAFGSGWNPAVPTNTVGQGFFLSAASAYTWGRTFTVQ